MGENVRFDDKRLMPITRKTAWEIGQQFGITNIGGFAVSGHGATSDHYTGLALDIRCNMAQGNQVSQWLAANGDRLGIRVILWNTRTWSPARGWYPTTPGDGDHRDHVHVSFKAVSPAASAAQGWTPEQGAGAAVPTGGSTDPNLPPADMPGCMAWLGKLFGQ